MRSFSNLWFWIALAVMWSTASHRVLGVPFDMVVRARRRGGEAMTDFEEMVRVNVKRMLLISRLSGAWILGLTCFLLTMIGVLAFWYGIEFAQAVFLLSFPMAIVGLLTLRTARAIAAEAPRGEALCRRILRLRLTVQAIGMVSIFVTALYGMYRNLAVTPGF